MGIDNTSIIYLIMNASFFVQIVLGLLLLCSIISWSIILSKYMYLGKVKFESMIFLKQYSSSLGISNLYNIVAGRHKKNSTIAVFFQGISQFNKLTKKGIFNRIIILENIERSLEIARDMEIDKCSSSLGLLATFGSVSPYIGLLGTVWGIMHAFIGLGSTGQATLSQVAPGIAEALIATAAGLVVAIPAYFFYNKFIADIDHIANKMDLFSNELLNLINEKLVENEKNSVDNV